MKEMVRTILLVTLRSTVRIAYCLLLTAYCLLPTANCAAQDSTLHVSLIQKFTGEYKDFAVDNLGNLYLLSSTNQLKKLDANGDSVAVYNDVKRYGNITSIDVTNPLKTLVYYKDFSTLITLDRLLSVRNTLNLRQHDLLQVSTLAMSYDNNVWVYDEMNSRIKKVDDNGNVLLEFNDFRQAFDSAPVPAAMFDRDGQLFIYDSLKGIFVFDYYGAKKHEYALTHVSDISIPDKNIITARRGNSLVLYKPALLQLISFKVFEPQKQLLKTWFTSTRIYCLTASGEVEVYEIK